MNDSEIRETIHEMGRRALAASRVLAQLGTGEKDQALHAMASALETRAPELIDANAKDLEAARTKGLSPAMLDRLALDPGRIAAMADGLRQVASLPDPVGETLEAWERPNGLRIEKKRVPIGVIGIIYESRPNVTSDAAALCLKTGNATLLRGGSEAFHSNTAIARVLGEAGAAAGLPPDCVQLVPFTQRESVRHLAEMDQYLDLIIPRGGKGLIETVVSLARMPVIKHYDGVCHVYIDQAADLDVARNIVIDSKTQKPSVCNAAETVLVHAGVAEKCLRDLVPALTARGVEVRGDERTVAAAPEPLVAASDDDWSTEYLDLIVAIKTVDDLGEAIDHINRYGSHHTDTIVTTDATAAERFLAEVDSSVVMWNSSTRFNDGEEFGFGAEIGISTDKLHARGPMGLRELTSYKYLVRGDGQTKAPAG